MHQEEQEEEEDLETQGRLTRVTVETQVSGNTPQNQHDLPQSLLHSNLKQLSDLSKHELIMNSGRAKRSSWRSWTRRDGVEEEVEVKSEDQTADVSQPDQKVRKANPVVL